MRAGMWMVIAGAAACAAKQAPPPAAPQAAPAPAVAVAGDPDEGGQIAQASPPPMASASTSTTAAAPAAPPVEVAQAEPMPVDAIAGAPDSSGLARGGGGGVRAPDRDTGGGTGSIGGGMRTRTGTHEPRIAPGTPRAGEGLAPEIIRRVVLRNIMRFKYCYEKSLQQDPSYAALLSLEFTIAADGSVVKAHAKLSRNNQPLAECVVRSLQSMQFPKPQGGATIEVAYPFNLSP